MTQPNARLEAHPRLGWIVFVGLFAPGLAIGFVLGSWDIWNRPNLEWWGSLLIIIVLAAIFLPMLAGCLWGLARAVRHRPFLRIDERGLLIGDDWERDLGIKWVEIAKIRAKRVRSRGYSDRVFLVEPIDTGAWRSRYHGLLRFAIWGNQTFLRAPFLISTTQLAVSFEELVEAISAGFGREVDLSESLP